MGLKASDILDFDDLRTKVVKVKDWKRDLTIRELGLDDGIKLLSMAEDIGDSAILGAKEVAQVVAWGVIDDNGERLFSDEDVQELMKKNRKPLMQLYREITSLSGKDTAKN